jgi:hypothetical protein
MSKPLCLDRFRHFAINELAGLPEERYVRQQVVGLCELIEMIDAIALAPVQK